MKNIYVVVDTNDYGCYMGCFSTKEKAVAYIVSRKDFIDEVLLILDEYIDNQAVNG
jgi:hypothetical protein